MTIQEMLEALSAQGWNDARISVWITDEIRKQFPFDQHALICMGPSSQSVYRWRRGKSKPGMAIWIRLIGSLYEQEGSSNDQKS